MKNIMEKYIAMLMSTITQTKPAGGHRPIFAKQSTGTVSMHVAFPYKFQKTYKMHYLYLFIPFNTIANILKDIHKFIVYLIFRL